MNDKESVWLVPLTCIAFASCASTGNYSMSECEFTLSDKRDRLLMGSREDETSLWDRNRDGRPDVLRWYRGSGYAYEKIDSDFDGYWNAVVGKDTTGKVVTMVATYGEKEVSIKNSEFAFEGVRPYTPEASKSWWRKE